MNEKRKEHRFRALLPMRIVHGNKEIVATTENISRLGTYVEVNRELHPGATVDLVIMLPASAKDPSLTGEIRCKGNVFRCAQIRESVTGKYYGVGIFFTVFAEDRDRDKLSRYIDYLTEREEEDIREGVRRRREKEAAEKASRSGGPSDKKQEEFQKESLRLLHHIASQLQEIQLQLAAERKKK
ncbi:MAG: PilZ domain-containing protein [Candidatus Omnitrophica bacterium]|nr:PilZ domain-containing protein [Candidatus Omnitrophota bacterium]